MRVPVRFVLDDSLTVRTSSGRCYLAFQIHALKRNCCIFLSLDFSGEVPPIPPPPRFPHQGVRSSQHRPTGHTVLLSLHSPALLMACFHMYSSLAAWGALPAALAHSPRWLLHPCSVAPAPLLVIPAPLLGDCEDLLGESLTFSL